MSTPKTGEVITSSRLMSWIDQDYDDVVKRDIKWTRYNMPTNSPPKNNTAYPIWFKAFEVYRPRANSEDNFFKQGKTIDSETSSSAERSAYGVMTKITNICESWRHVRLVHAIPRKYGWSNSEAAIVDQEKTDALTQKGYAYVSDAYKIPQEILGRRLCKKEDYISINNISATLDDALNNWKNARPLVLTWDDCHANCHSNCHGSGGWR